MWRTINVAGLGDVTASAQSQVVAFDVLAEVLERDAPFGRLAHARAVEIALHSAREWRQDHDPRVHVERRDITLLLTDADQSEWIGSTHDERTDLEDTAPIRWERLDDDCRAVGLDARQLDGQHAVAELFERDATRGVPPPQIGDAQFAQRPLADGDALGLEFAHGSHTGPAHDPDGPAASATCKRTRARGTSDSAAASRTRERTASTANVLPVAGEHGGSAFLATLRYVPT